MIDIAFGRHPHPGRPPGRRERKKLDTRQRIFRTAFDLFQEKGFEATTVEEIAQGADVGKGTVFNYFPQKAAFLVAAYQEWVNVLLDELGPVESWQGSARTQLGRVFSYLTDLAVENRILARQVIFENMRQAHLRMTREEGNDSPGGAGGTPAPDSAADDPEPVRLLEIMTREVIQKGKDNAEIRPETDVPQAASLIAAAAFHTMVRGLVREDSARAIKASLAAKLDIIFTGVAP